MIQQVHFWVNAQKHERGTPRDMRTPRFLAASFTTAQQLPKMEATQVSIDGWTDKQNVVCMYNRIAALKRKEILTPATTWMNLEAVMRRELSQAQKDKHYDFTCVRFPRAAKVTETESRVVTAVGRGSRGGHRDSCLMEIGVSVWEDGNSPGNGRDWWVPNNMSALDAILLYT